MLELKLKEHILRIIQGDITEQSTDAIVNAANSSLVLGAGVAGAIRWKGGPSIQTECNKIGYTPTGKAAITHGGNLSSKYIIHAVGPIWGEQSDQKSEELLASAILECLHLCIKNQLHSITFPAISTGIYGFPKSLAAILFKKVILNFLEQNPGSLLVQICLYSSEDYRIFEQEFKKG